MPFKGNRGPLLIIAAVLIIIILIAVAAASSSSPVKPKPQGLSTCTVAGEVGLSQVRITNQNTGKSIIKTAADLPYSFNFTSGDTLKFEVTTITGFTWNSWELSASPWFAQDNPLIIRVDGNINMHATCLVTGE